MAEQHHDHLVHQQNNDHSTSNIVAVLALFPIGGFCFLFATLILTGTLIFLAFATPLFVIFSPVIVPALLTIGLAITGFMTSGAFGITGLTALTYICNYFRKMSYGNSVIDYGKNKKASKDTTGHVGQKVGSRSC